MISAPSGTFIMRDQLYRSVCGAFCLALLLVFNAAAQKLEASDVIAKHKAAIGPGAALDSVKNQLIMANAQFTFKGGANVITGKALVLSTSDKTLWGMNFASNDYPQDRFGFDGKSVRVGKATPTSRSLVGDFLMNNTAIIREGLLGGALSAAWPLLREDVRKAKVKYDGTRSVDGRDVVVLSYEPRSASDLSIKLFFDAKTFRHTRTEYTLVRNAGQGPTVDSSAGQSGTTYKLIEEFAGFKKMGRLILPAEYTMTYSRSTAAATTTAQTTNRDAVWTFSVTDVGFNREIDDNSFNIDAK